MSHPLPPDLGPSAFGVLSWGWSAEPVLTAGLVATAGLYAVGARRLASRARGRAAPPRWRARCFAVGLATLALATLSPLHAWGEHLFAAHMVQHLLLIMAAAPLLLFGAPLVPVLWGLPRRWRRAVARGFVPGHPVRRAVAALVRPAVAVTLSTGTVALWHWPALYDAAQGRTLVHDLEHLLFMGTALLYWWPLVHPVPGARPLSAGAALLYLVPPMVVGDAIGAVLAFAPAPLYATYAGGASALGLSALADQRIGGLIMWIGGGLLWLAAMALALFLLPAEPRRTARSAQHPSTA